MKTTRHTHFHNAALGAAAGLLIACGSATATPNAPQKSDDGVSHSAATSVGGPSACTIGGTTFKPVYAKREDDADDNAVRVFIFSTAPATSAEKKNVCERATPIPSFAVRSDKRVVEVDFNDAANLTKNYDVLFLTHTDGNAYNHDQQESAVADLKGSGSAQTIHVKVKSDGGDCELTVPVSPCPP
jgi:hypothetical protein